MTTPKLLRLENRDWVFDAIDIQTEQRAVELLKDYASAVLETASAVAEQWSTWTPGDPSSVTEGIAAEIRKLK